ncbi:hypothetical protein GCM10007862_09360 [Dyella lipolytica]|uniref:Uncharacterized protein n=1 Tax=Dyella lipolytica TaxID=1867835 RepID=A0ABW8J0Z5_9GAMM|nr:hypothetical protein [Dyella lipolytica]GLQ45885.1 hypothetical protein GCM10007862_09360 [Dyella lipolytica]
MNIASRLKLLALGISTGLVFVASASYASTSINLDSVYVPNDLSVTQTSAAGVKQTLSYMQGAKLESQGSNTNNELVQLASSGAFGLADAAVIVNTDSTLTTCTNGCGEPVQIQSSMDNNYVLNGLVTMNNVVDQVSVQASANGQGPYVFNDNLSLNIQVNGVNIPVGTYNAASAPIKLTNVPVSVIVGSTTETDMFNGKITFGKLTSIWSNGQISGTQFTEVNVNGTVTDSAGNVYSIDEDFGETTLNGIPSNQVTTNFVVTQNAN